MASFQQLQQQFAQSLTQGSITATGGMTPALANLVDSLPYYGDPDFQAAHRGALTTLLAVNMPNSAVAPHPPEGSLGYYATYDYTGDYSGYQSFFFSDISPSPASSNVALQVGSLNANLGKAFWGNYGVAILTDAIRLTLGFPLNTGKLANDIANAHSLFLSGLPASCYAIYRVGFTPTETALSKIANPSDAYVELEERISLLGLFTTNINQAIAMGGDNAAAAVWFLFNLWITFKALGLSDSEVDYFITVFKNVALTYQT